MADPGTHAQTSIGTKQLDEARVQAFVGQVLTDSAATVSTALAFLGDRLGLYKAMSDAGALTPTELAQRAHLHERYVREWLVSQAAGGYISYDAASGRYTLPDEHAAVLSDENSPMYVGGLFYIATAVARDEPKIEERFHSGEGLLWGNHDPLLYTATERLFRPGYQANLLSQWLPALDGVVAKLHLGASVADVGCGWGASTILMAQAFPRSRFRGFDFHPESIEHARAAAQEAGVADRATFEVAAADAYPGTDYDLVAYFDCLHDMGDPKGSLQHTARVLAHDGTVMIVEPMAGERIEESFNPVGRLYTSASVILCTPNALASGEMALGNQVPEQTWRELAQEAGLSRFRRVAETPFNRIFEARL